MVVEDEAFGWRAYPQQQQEEEQRQTRRAAAGGGGGVRGDLLFELEEED